MKSRFQKSREIVLTRFDETRIVPPRLTDTTSDANQKRDDFPGLIKQRGTHEQQIRISGSRPIAPEVVGVLSPPGTLYFRVFFSLRAKPVRSVGLSPRVSFRVSIDWVPV